MLLRGQRDSIPHGTLDMLILRKLAGGKEMHGFEIADHRLKYTESILHVDEGSLYPALQRLLVHGRILGDWHHAAQKTKPDQRT
jgi:PadR family transcriptional regulator, regulatory protein PadR